MWSRHDYMKMDSKFQAEPDRHCMLNTNKSHCQATQREMYSQLLTSRVSEYKQVQTNQHDLDLFLADLTCYLHDHC